ncbi:MAG: hypothetical protein ACLTW9_26330 [Enterocloster sp.]
MAADCKAPFLALAIHYLEDFLRDKNYSTVLCCTGYELENKKKRLEFLLTKNVDAVILVGSGFVDCDDFLNQYIRDAADKDSCDADKCQYVIPKYLLCCLR